MVACLLAALIVWEEMKSKNSLFKDYLDALLLLVLMVLFLLLFVIYARLILVVFRLLLSPQLLSSPRDAMYLF